MFSRYLYHIAQFILIAFIVVVYAAPKKDTGIYVSHTSNVQLLGRRNFDSQISNARQKGVSIVHYYRNNDQGSREFAVEYELLASEWRGVFKIAAVNCDEDYDVCEKERVSRTPLVKIYPPLPVPAFEHEGELSTKLILNDASRYVQSNVMEVNSTNIEKFTQDNPSVPKALLFTDKKGIPLIFKALSQSFEKKIFFGVVRSEEKDVFDKYSITKTPEILIVKVSEKKPIAYKGEMKYKPIFDFMNVYSEAFVAGGENMDASKPWLKETVPELTRKSANDVCFKGEGGLCVILISKGVPEKAALDEIEQVQKNNRGEGSHYRFMWLNADTNSEFASTFGVQEYPKVAVFSPGKRKKFLLHENEIQAAKIDNTLEVINNGDARFTHIKIDLPDLN